MKLTRLFMLLATVSAIALLGTGCGGISGSHSISPASFFLPGLLQNKSKVQEVEPIAATPSGNQVQAVANSL